jgi:hypothetical protein
MMRGAKFVRPPFGTELLANACIIYGEKALTADPDMEEEHEPCFWVEEGLDHLVLLERLILYARLVLSDLVTGLSGRRMPMTQAHTIVIAPVIQNIARH